MTMNHYINKNDEQFIDNAFQIGINFVFSAETSKSISERDAQLDLCS
jgi:hypothetical protein